MLGCGNASDVAVKQETLSSGLIHISVDESFRPVIDSQIQVFESQHPNAKIIVHYKPEAECLQDLQVDSIRMVIVTRGLEESEQKQLKKKLQFAPRFGILAYDAIAMIVHANAKDSMFTMQDVRSMVKGTSNYPYKVVLDGKIATSTVRFMVDSLLKGEKPSSNVEGALGSEAVLKHVAENPSSVGLIGVSWIGNPEDPDQQSFLKKVKIASVECRDCEAGPYVKPYQANIYNARYPMIRPLFYILKENYDGLGSGLMNFMVLEKGQKIFKRAYLLPAKMTFRVQKIDISE